jgi:hypothetical protein
MTWLMVLWCERAGPHQASFNEGMREVRSRTLM